MNHIILLVFGTVYTDSAITRFLLLSLVNVTMHKFSNLAIAIMNDDIVYVVNLILDTKSEMECDYKGGKYFKMHFRKIHFGLVHVVEIVFFEISTVC